MPNYQKRIVYLSEEQLSQLYANGSITVGGTTITYSDNDMYVTPQSEPIYPVSNATSGNFVSLTSSGNISDSGHKHSDYVTVSQKGANNGVAELDNEGKIITSQLPGSVDEIKECDSRSAFPQQGEADKIYVAKDTNLAYRWSGSDYVEISPSLALGETSSTAYRGDRGKTAYDHASAKGSAFESGLYKITTNAEGHVTNATNVQKTDITNLGIPGDLTELIDDEHSLQTKTYSSDKVDTDFAKKTDIPTVPVTDVQINETSILNNGVANIPAATSSDLGAVKVDNTLGISIQSNKKLVISKASDDYIKSGASLYKPIVPANQHTSAFYALAKLAGADMASSSNPVGTYTDAAKQGIQKLFGLDGLVGDYQDGNTASKAYSVGNTFIMNGKRYKVTAAISDGGLITVGTNCELDPLDGKYVRNTDYALNNGDYGLVKLTSGSYGVMRANDGYLMVAKATEGQIKAGENANRPIVPQYQHESAFYGLAKAAGDTTQASSDNAVGTYTDNAKTAILAMLGISLSNANSAQEVIAAYTNSAIRTDASGVSF